MEHRFTIPDMTCGGCANRVTRAIETADRAARVHVQMRERKVTITGSAPRERYASAIEGAGYTPVAE